MKKNKTFPGSKDDKYNVESSSARDIDGYATTEMTGLIPSQIVDEGELDSYKNIFPFSPEEYVE